MTSNNVVVESRCASRRWPAFQVKSPWLNLQRYLLTAGPFSFQRCHPSRRTQARIKNCKLFGSNESKLLYTAHMDVATYEPSKLGRAVHVVYSTAGLCVRLRNEQSRQNKSVQKWANNKSMPRSIDRYTRPGVRKPLFFSLSCSFHRFRVIELESFWQ